MARLQSANKRRQSAKMRSLPEQETTSKAPSKAAAVKATAVTDDPATATAGVRLTALRNQIGWT